MMAHVVKKVPDFPKSVSNIGHSYRFSPLSVSHYISSVTLIVTR